MLGECALLRLLYKKFIALKFHCFVQIIIKYSYSSKNLDDEFICKAGERLRVQIPERLGDTLPTNLLLALRRHRALVKFDVGDMDILFAILAPEAAAQRDERILDNLVAPRRAGGPDVRQRGGKLGRAAAVGQQRQHGLRKGVSARNLRRRGRVELRRRLLQEGDLRRLVTDLEDGGGALLAKVRARSGDRGFDGLDRRQVGLEEDGLAIGGVGGADGGAEVVAGRREKGDGVVRSEADCDLAIYFIRACGSSLYLAARRYQCDRGNNRTCSEYQYKRRRHG